MADTRLVEQVQISLSIEDKIALAWALMTEGSIIVRIVHRPTSQYAGYVPVLTFTSTDIELTQKVQWITRCGHIYHVKVPRRPQERDTWRWSLHRVREILSILDQVYPYLIIKRKQAWLTMEICRLKLERGLIFNQSTGRRPTFERETEIYLTVKSLNRAHKSLGRVVG
jgi:hypothetical protein